MISPLRGFIDATTPSLVRAPLRPHSSAVVARCCASMSIVNVNDDPSTGGFVTLSYDGIELVERNAVVMQIRIRK